MYKCLFLKTIQKICLRKYRYSDGSSLPATGDIVTVDGVFDGNYKKIIPSENAKLISPTPSKT